MQQPRPPHLNSPLLLPQLLWPSAARFAWVRRQRRSSLVLSVSPDSERVLRYRGGGGGDSSDVDDEEDVDSNSSSSSSSSSNNNNYGSASSSSAFSNFVSASTTQKTTKDPSSLRLSAYEVQLEAIKSRIVKNALERVADLRLQLEQGQVIEKLGAQADEIVHTALQDFSQLAPTPSDADDHDDNDDTDNNNNQKKNYHHHINKSAVYDRTLTSVESTIDAPLHVLYLQQLAYLREQALQRFRTTVKTTSVSDYEAMLQADSHFVAAAQEATRTLSVSSSSAASLSFMMGGKSRSRRSDEDAGDADADAQISTSSSGLGSTACNWEYASERSFLQAVLNNIAESGRKITDIQTSAAQQSQTAMQFLQSQQQMIQQLQMQLYGQSSPWNVGIAYRIPDTNLNVQGTYQQGRSNIQLSCVPDEYAPFLGPNGFTNGVGPGNLGLSFNLSI